MIHRLAKKFTGIGEVSNTEFTQIDKSFSGFLYEVKTEHGDVYYEVFRKKTSPVCIDFEKREYSDTESKEVYPRSTSFGDWAWCIKDYDKAVEKFESLKKG